MMGRQTGDQGQLFYLFNLERRIPAGHFAPAATNRFHRALCHDTGWHRPP